MLTSAQSRTTTARPAELRNETERTEDFVIGPTAAKHLPTHPTGRLTTPPDDSIVSRTATSSPNFDSACPTADGEFATIRHRPWDFATRRGTLQKLSGSRRGSHPPAPTDPGRRGTCRFAYSVSSDDPLTSSDASCLTRRHLASVSYSCHFFRATRICSCDGYTCCSCRRAYAWSSRILFVTVTVRTPRCRQLTPIAGTTWLPSTPMRS